MISMLVGKLTENNDSTTQATLILTGKLNDLGQIWNLVSKMNNVINTISFFENMKKILMKKHSYVKNFRVFHRPATSTQFVRFIHCTRT